MSLFANPAGDAAGHAPAYVRALLGRLGGRDPLTVLEATPARLRDTLAAFPPRHRATPEAPGKWSAAQVVGHLADSEWVNGFRVRLMLAEERPPIAGYDQDAWAARFAPDVAADLDRFEALRGFNLALWRGLSDADLAREGLHSERGPESVGRLLRLLAAHDDVHLDQVRRIHRAVAV